MKKKAKKITQTTILQSLYLTSAFCFTNDIYSYAASSAFSFLFSFVPVVLLIVAILIRIMHASPDTILSILSSTGVFSETFDLEHAVNQVLSVKTITVFEIVLVFSIIWMGRRFFASIMQNMYVIFKQHRKPRPVLTQLFIFLCEFIIIIFTATLIFAIISFKALRNSGALEKMFPHFPERLTTYLANFLPMILLFISLLCCYRFESGTKPKWIKCAMSAFACTLTFFIFQRLMGLFINVSKYNLVYGILSNVIVLLMEAYIFFQLFFFFAQYLYVSQFFDELLLAELYLLPDESESGFFSKLKRKLFIRPDYIIYNKKNILKFAQGETIYKKDDLGSDAYYIVKGSVEIKHSSKTQYLKTGAFFGEEACMIEEGRNESAIACEDTTLITIPKETFQSLLDRNPKVTKAALSHISSYFAKVYNGRREDFGL